MIRLCFSKSSGLICKRFRWNKCTSSIRKRYLSGSDLESQKTEVRFLDKQEDAGLMINGFNQFGFRLSNGIFVFGSAIVFPQTVLSWHVQDAQDINVESLSLFYVLEPKLDILVIGVGDKGVKLEPSIVTFLTHKKKLNLEILPTERACSTFNFLLSEGRFVGAALIPPTSIEPSEDDVISTRLREKRQFGITDF